MKKTIVMMLALLGCLTMVACGDVENSEEFSTTSGLQTESQAMSETETDTSSVSDVDESSGYETETDTSSASDVDESLGSESGENNVVTPIQPGGDYNVGSDYGN